MFSMHTGSSPISDVASPAGPDSAAVEAASRPTAEDLHGLRDWAQQFRTPGAWGADAWRALAPALVTLPGWRGLLLVLADSKAVLHGGELRPDGDYPSGPLLTLCQGSDATSWAARRRTDDAGTTVVSGDRPGDNCLLTLLKVWPTGSGAVPDSPMALRLAIADALLQEVESLQCRPGPGSWVESLLKRPLATLRGGQTERCLPHLPTPTPTPKPVEVPSAPPKAAGVSMPWKAEAGRRPAPVTPQNQAHVNRALSVVKRGRVDLACDALRMVRPRSEVPVVLLRMVCQRAVEMKHLPPVLSLFKDLSDDGTLLLPSLGLSLENQMLDLHLSAVFAKFPPDHENARESHEGVSRAEATVLFELHRQRGDLGPGSRVVVGHSGAGVLRRTILGLAQEQGWNVTSPMASVDFDGRHGQVMISLPGQDSLPAPRGRLRPDGVFMLNRLRRQLEQSSLREDADDLAKDQARISGAVAAAPVQAVMDVMDDFGHVGVDHYRVILCALAVRSGADDEFDTALRHMEERVGKVPLEAWRQLISLVNYDHRGGWDAALTMLRRMESMGYKPTVDHLEPLLECAGSLQDARAAMAFFDEAVASGLPPDPRLDKALLRSSARCGFRLGMSRFDAELKRRGLERDPHVRQSHLIFAAKSGRVESALHQLQTLRSDGVALEVDTLKHVIQGLSDVKRWGDAADVVARSIRAEDGIYRPNPGWSDVPGKPSCLALFPSEVYIQPADKFSGSSLLYYVSWAERMVLLHLHGLQGHLRPGVLLRLSGAVVDWMSRDVQGMLQPWGLDVRQVRDADGVQQVFYEIVARDVPDVLKR